MEKDLFTLYEFLSEANSNCVKMCYNPNLENLLTTQKEDGQIEVYGCHHNCMQKMNTTMNLLNEYAKSHPRFVARQSELKSIRDEQAKAVFSYGSKDYQNFQI